MNEAREPSPSNFGQRLSELHSLATRGPWHYDQNDHGDGYVTTKHGTSYLFDRDENLNPIADAELVAFLLNHAEAILALVTAATDVYQNLHRAQDCHEKEALWSALEAAVEGVNG